MPRYKLTIEYDGAPFVGWQRQDNGPSVQGALEDAVLAFSGERVTRAGRRPHRLRRPCAGPGGAFRSGRREARRNRAGALNFHLKPDPIAVTEAEIVPADFHARFSATGRRYRYLILNRRAPPAIDRGRVWHVPVPLDSDAMADAAAVLLGHHDFNSFRSTACQAPHRSRRSTCSR